MGDDFLFRIPTLETITKNTPSMPSLDFFCEGFKVFLVDYRKPLGEPDVKVVDTLRQYVHIVQDFRVLVFSTFCLTAQDSFESRT